MKNLVKIFVAIMLILAISNCKKNNEKREVPPEKFHYVEFNPMLEIHCGDSLYLDLNNDKIPDLRFYVVLVEYFGSTYSVPIIQTFSVYQRTIYYGVYPKWREPLKENDAIILG